jgi:hypothetical protein
VDKAGHNYLESFYSFIDFPDRESKQLLERPRTLYHWHCYLLDRISPRYRADMKKQTAESRKSITGEMIKPLADLHHETVKRNIPAPALSQERPQGSAEYQDNGGGYNSNFVIPQN